MRPAYPASHWLTVVIFALGPALGACNTNDAFSGGLFANLLGGGSNDPADSGDATGSTDAGTIVNESPANALTIYTNPGDPLLVDMPAADGGKIEAYGEKSADGLATALTALRYQDASQTGADATWVEFDSAGNVTQITGADGSTISFNWTSETTAVLTGVSADGTRQVETEVDLAAAASGRLRSPRVFSRERLGVAPRGGRRLAARVVDEVEGTVRSVRSQRVTAVEAASASISKRSAFADTGAAQVYVHVTRCGSAVDGAMVSVTLDNPYRPLPATYTARSTGTSGEYVATVPVVPVSNAGERAEEICKSLEGILDLGCKFAKVSEGQESYVCITLAAAIDAALLGPTGEGAGILAACEAGYAALKAYCSTLGADGGEGSPSIAAHFICGNIKGFVDRAQRDPAQNLALQAWANAKGLPPASSASQTVAPTGPFPSLSIEFPNTGPIVHPIVLSPADPAPGEGYVASVRIECVSPDTLVTLSVAGSDGYTDSTSISVQGDSTAELFVPGADAGVGDLISIQISGVTRLQVAVVF